MKTIKTALLFAFIGLNIAFQAQNTTPTVKMGPQEWTTKNLDVVAFRNGDSIPEAKTFEAWKKAEVQGTPAWCYYDFDPKNGEKYGKLYNWFAVNDPRGVAPKGYHVPSEAEWKSLVSYLGGEKKAGQKLKSTEGWSKHPIEEKGRSYDGNGTNESGFSGLPGGILSVGSFDYDGYIGYWWSSTEDEDYSANNVWYYALGCIDDLTSGGFANKGEGKSVRCVRD